MNWMDIDNEQPSDGEEVYIKYETGQIGIAVACWYDENTFDGWMVDALCWGDFLPPDARIVAWAYKP